MSYPEVLEVAPEEEPELAVVLAPADVVPAAVVEADEPAEVETV